MTKPCSQCGKRVTGAHWRCLGCGACICFYCGVTMTVYPPACPKCGAKLV
ncbi:MAG: hypothetical protein WCC63_07040 [Candidatus Bathyarchaeia archaeon]